MHDRYQEWGEAGVFERMWKQGLAEYDEKKGLEWEWQSMDGAVTKVQFAGEATDSNPTNRARLGTKRSLLV